MGPGAMSSLGRLPGGGSRTETSLIGMRAFLYLEGTWKPVVLIAFSLLGATAPAPEQDRSEQTKQTGEQIAVSRSFLQRDLNPHPAEGQCSCPARVEHLGTLTLPDEQGTSTPFTNHILSPGYDKSRKNKKTMLKMHFRNKIKFHNEMMKCLELNDNKMST